MDLDVRDLHRTQRALAIGRHARNLLDQFDGRIIALPEDGVAAVQAGVGNFGDEKLRAIGVGSGIRVGETARTIEFNVGEVSFLNL